MHASLRCMPSGVPVRLFCCLFVLQESGRGDGGSVSARRVEVEGATLKHRSLISRVMVLFGLSFWRLWAGKVLLFFLSL